MKKQVTRILSICICIILSISMISGCGSTQKSSDQTQEQSKSSGRTESAAAQTEAAKKELMEYKVFQWEWDFQKDDRIIANIQDKFNVKFDIIQCSWSEWVEKLRLLIASGDIPDIFPSSGPGDPDYENISKEGILLDITDLLNNYPNLKKPIEDESSKYYRTNGRFLGYPRLSNDNVAQGYIIRQDWLDKLGLKAPQTYDELYEVAKQFVEKEPDGKKNVGLSFSHPWFLYPVFSAYTGINDNWGFKDGKYVHVAVDPGYKEALKYLNKLYNEKLLDPDYILAKVGSDVDKFNLGQTGLMYEEYNATIYAKIMDTLKKNNPNASISVLMPPKGPAGAFSYKLPTAYFTMTCFRKDIKNPERVLELMDYLASEEGINLLRYGIEGVHYSVADGKKVRNENEYQKDNFSYGDKSTHLLNMFVRIDKTFWSPGTGSYGEIVTKYMDEMKPYGLADKVTGFASENNTKLTPVLKDIFDTYQAKFITGKLDIDKYWDEYVTKYRKAGYDTLEQEVNTYMNKYK